MTCSHHQNIIGKSESVLLLLTLLKQIKKLNSASICKKLLLVFKGFLMPTHTLPTHY